MSLYYEDGGLRLFHGSNKDILPTFADEAFDSIVTDPPYELGFMGKGWDSSGIAYDVEMWRECWRVLKPGGYLLAFGGTRTWHRIATAIENAGFEVRDSMAWLYGSGFPKSMDVSKAIDKAAGAEREVVSEGKRGANRPEVPGQSQGKAYRLGGDASVTAPATDAAREWEGWGTALKPAFEPIIVARKPLAGTVAANVLAYGTGALNIDATRIATTDDLSGNVNAERVMTNEVYGKGLGVSSGRSAELGGRWPSNVLLDESQATLLDEQSGTSRSRIGKPRGAASGEGWGMTATGAEYDDEGGASRFFPTFRYEAKAPGSERPEVDGVAHATVKPLDLMRWLVRLVTRRGGHVLDPFAGSGTTGEAALLEGMESTLIELESDHLPLILARVKKPLQPSMFGDWEEEAS